MKIWFINHYAVPPQYYPLARPSLLAKNLIKQGNKVTIIAASTVHNSDKNLIEDNSEYLEDVVDGIPYIYIRCSSYNGNGFKRVVNILQFARRLANICDQLEKPDVIMATSFDPLSCYQGIKYAKKHGIKAIAEIADLWPETLVEYTSLSKNNPAVKYLRMVEKRIYVMADAIVFTMEGAYDYIKEQQWEKIVPKNKVFFINNGIDIQLFDYNKENYITNDLDLQNDSIYKVVYAGAIRKVNNLDKLIDIAKLVKNPEIRFLVWGDGDELSRLEKRIKDEKIKNVIFKGRVEKKYIPYITSNADLNFAHNNTSPLFRFGISFNKIFDYLAAGKPIICDFAAKYNPVTMVEAGISVDSGDVEEIAMKIDEFSHLDNNTKKRYSVNARKGAQKYDFKNLTYKLIKIINDI